MSDDRLVYETLNNAGVPVARLTWGPSSCVPPTPYAVYEVLPTSNFADNANYPTVPRYRATIWTDEADEDAIERFRGAVASLGTYIMHTPTYDHHRGLYVHSFDFSLLRTDS